MRIEMTQLEKLLYLNHILLDEMPQYKEQGMRFAQDEESQYRLFRSLVNIRPAMECSEDFLKIQDAYLQQNIGENTVVNLQECTQMQPNIYLWKGDITRLEVDAIVNAANDALLGCFVPCHGCIDNAIHTKAGVQLRKTCDEIMKKQGHREETGVAKLTAGYNLPCKYIIHTVGPIIYGRLREEDCELLKSCYRSCMELAIQNNLESIAFCCISTGEFHFPNEKACEIAVEEVRQILEETKSEIKVVFNVFKEIDYELYGKLLG